MTPPYRRLVFALVLYVHVVVLYASSVPGGEQAMAVVPGADKVGHAAVFGAVVLAALWARFPARWVVPLALGHAVLSEIIQHRLVTGRTGDVWDAVADVVGVGLGWFAATLIRRRRAERGPSGPDR